MFLRNTIYNLLGLGAPLLVAVVSIPQLITALGTDRFGLLTLIWAVVSYFGLFDLGLGRALTQQLAVLFSNEEHEKVGPLVVTATALMSVLGVAAGALMAAGAHWGVDHIQAVPDRQEAINAVYCMAMAMPAIVLTSCFRGILEAKHAFGTINLIRFPMGLFTFLGPLGVVIYGEPRLDWIAALLATGRLVACATHAWFAWRLLPNPHGALVARRNLLGPLCVSGGWLTVSNIISPLMGYLDRFLIATIVSTSAVAYYATPNELVTKLWIVPGALTAVLFPTFAIQIAKRDAQACQLFTTATLWLALVMLPPTLALALFSHSLLSIWINPIFADQAAVLLQLFALGTFVSCLAQIPFTIIQSSGNSRTTAIIHCIELPFYLSILWLMTTNYGPIGTACAWLLRIGVDATMMFAASRRFLGDDPITLLPRILRTLVFSTLSFTGTLLPAGTSRALWLLFVVSIIAWTMKTSYLLQSERPL